MFNLGIEKYQKKNGLAPTDPRETGDRQPRYDLWEKVSTLPDVEEVPRSQTKAPSQPKGKKLPTSISKQGREPRTPAKQPVDVDRMIKHRRSVYEDATPQLSQKAKGKQRAVAREEEEEESEEDEEVVSEEAADDVLPTLHEHPEDEGQDNLVQDQREAIFKEVDDPGYAVQAGKESSLKDGTPEHTLAYPESHDFEARDVEEIEGMIDLPQAGPQQTGWTVLQREANETQSEQEEIDQLESDDRP